MVRFFPMNARMVVAAALSVAACGGSTPAANTTEDPSLGDGAESVASESPEVQKAKDAIGAGDYAKAVQLLEPVVSRTPNDAQAQFYLGVGYEGTSARESAAAAYRRAIESNPSLVDAYVNLSALLLDGENPGESAKVASEGLKKQPDHPDLLTNSALALEQLQKYDESLAAYGRAVDASPSNHELRFAYADLLARSEKPAQARAQLKQVLDGASDARVLAAAGHLLATLGDFAECVAAFDKALAAEKNAQLHVRRGLCRHELKDDQGAQADFESAIAIDADNAPAHYYLGRHLATKDTKKACEHLRAAESAGEGGVAKSAKAALKKAGCK